MGIDMVAVNGPFAIGADPPRLSVCRMQSPSFYDCIVEHALDDLVGEVLLEGASTTEQSVIRVPSEPGWYFVRLLLPMADSHGTTAVLALQPFFVRYPAGEVMEGTLAVEQQGTREGQSLTVHEVALSQKETTVRYSVTSAGGARAIGREVALRVTGSKPLVLLRVEEQAMTDRVTGVAVFGPTPSGADSLSFELRPTEASSKGKPLPPLTLEINLRRTGS